MVVIPSIYFLALCSLHSVTPFIISGWASSQPQHVIPSPFYRYRNSAAWGHAWDRVSSGLGIRGPLTPPPHLQCSVLFPAAFRCVLMESWWHFPSCLGRMTWKDCVKGDSSALPSVQEASSALEVSAWGSGKGSPCNKRRESLKSRLIRWSFFFFFHSWQKTICQRLFSFNLLYILTTFIS